MRACAVLIPSSSGQALEHGHSGGSRRVQRVLIPSSSGQALEPVLGPLAWVSWLRLNPFFVRASARTERRHRQRLPGGSSLNPFFVRASARTSKPSCYGPSARVLIPSSSGQALELDGGAELHPGFVLIPSSSGQALERWIQTTWFWRPPS